MKNNKKYDRTFKLSLVAVALSMANIAWANNIACQPGGVDIIGENGATLRQCDLTHEITSFRSGKITVESSQNSVITDSVINVGTNEYKGIFIKNSTLNLNNLNLSVSEPLEEESSNLGIDILDSSTVNINGGNYRGQADKNSNELFRVSDSSTLNINRGCT
ncbi:hypothetical protein, partial [Rodentibacter rarus]|uniref:hypothetical protein n=1 Tax=Rodentibacter rarus TaxID=1908260 RepID=UPI00117B15FC